MTVSPAEAAAAGDGPSSVRSALPVPKQESPLLAPLPSVVPDQLFAWALAKAKGLDPDEPRGLSKVTLAR
jgi:glutamine---fructose-6-phosphate transaminase (isomerizing)